QFKSELGKRDADYKAELSKHDAEHKAEIEKLESKLQQKSQVFASQIRQPKAPPSNLKTEEDYEKYYLAKFFKDLDGGSKIGGVNDATINALGWKADKPSDFAIKGNSKHITESLGWFTDVPVSIKDKDGKTVTAIGNFTHIDNGEPEPMLCLGMTWIRKVQGIFDPNKNQFRMKLHGKSYIIPTFNKAPEALDPPKEKQDLLPQVSIAKQWLSEPTISSNSTNEEDLKKKV
ncbi:7887_t:CDS:2, partial [Paraglomus brasilianum]